MKLTITQFSPPDRTAGGFSIDWGRNLIRSLIGLLSDLQQILNNGLTFQDNLQQKTVSVTAPGVANTEFTVAHNLSRKPLTYFVTADRACRVYNSTTAWTTTNIYLKCDTASAVLSVTVL